MRSTFLTHHSLFELKSNKHIERVGYGWYRLYSELLLEGIILEKGENEWLDFGSLPNADGSEDLLDPQADVESTIAGSHTSGSSNLRSWGRTFDESSRSLAV